MCTPVSGKHVAKKCAFERFYIQDQCTNAFIVSLGRANLIARRLTNGKKQAMARTTGSTNEQALAVFIAAKTEIDWVLAELTAISADHFHADPEAIHWGHVGSVNDIRDRLKEIASFASGKG